MAENASLFWTYTEMQRVIRWSQGIPLSQHLSLGQLALAGAGAGALTSFVLYVLSFVSCRLGELTQVIQDAH